MVMTSLTEDSELRKLPAHAWHQLGQMLAVGEAWKAVMGRVRRPDTGTELFTSEHIPLITEESRRSGRSETEILLDEWGTWGRQGQRPTIQSLINILTELNLYRAANYSNINVLDVPPVARPTSGPGGVVPHDANAVRELLDERLRATLGPEPPETGANTETPEPPADVRHFRYIYLEKVTSEFDERPLEEGGSQLGAGAYGTVFLGHCETTERLAIKRLIDNVEAVNKQFRTEVEVMSSFQHENLLELLGFSCDGPHNCLVYSYMVNGSLQDRLACRHCTAPLLWPLRLSIALGTARGVVHLHTSRDRPLIHRDIKSANILLDQNFTPKVGDFGLAREVAGGRTANTQLTTTVLGTSAYMPPEAFRGDVSVKLDTFSFGIVLLEILTGLPPYDETREGFDLLSHVEDHVDESCLEETLDPRAGLIPPDQAERVYRLAVQCTEEKRRRPLMASVLQQLQDLQPQG